MQDAIANAIHAGFPVVWIVTRDHATAERTAHQAAQRANKIAATWTVASGVPKLPTAAGASVLVAVHADRTWLTTPTACGAVAAWTAGAKADQLCVIVLASTPTIPLELEPHAIIIDDSMPDVDALTALAIELARSSGATPQTDTEIREAMRCAAGLTLTEAENAVSLSLVEHRAIRCDVLRSLKAQMVRKSGLLQVHAGTETFADIGGLAALKADAAAAVRSGFGRGLMLTGIPGTGKSALAKALGNETGRTTLSLDCGALFGSLVGQTEERVRRALAITDAMAPAILFIDEIEKALAGSSGANDSGVSARMLGTFLTWLNDHATDVYTIVTCNSMDKLPPELSRAGRFDSIFFLDVPSAETRSIVWNQYIAQYKISDDRAKRPADDGWTGAEIRQCCRLAQMLDCSLTEAANRVVPVTTSSADRVAVARSAATAAGYLCAETGTHYRHGQATAGSAPKPRRRINPSVN